MTSAVAEGASAQTSADSVPKLNLPPVIFLAALWAWAIYALSGYWRDFEQYSYGYFVPPLAAYFIWRRLGLFASRHPSGSVTGTGSIVAWSIGVGIAILPLEYLRLALPASRLTVWIISLVTIIYTLAFARRLGGNALMKSLAFPLLFFLSAAPWFSFLENNVTLGLMQYVAAIVTEILHLLGIKAEAKGTLISLTPGVVGIAEACSGIRSLQSGLMYSLAVGELFLLGTGRRVALVILTVICGFILNLARTFWLAYQADQHGLGIIDKIHDQVGVTTSLVLPVAVWGMGKLLAGVEPEPAKDAERPAAWAQRRLASFPNLVPAGAFALAAFLPWHVWLFYQDTTLAKQTKPYFIPRTNEVNITATRPTEEIWKALSPTSGGYLHMQDPALPLGRGDAWYFFWEPHKDNFNILWHHPERCMVGGGWVANGPKQDVDLTLNGKHVRWSGFPWKNANGQTFQIWGAWRNGSPVLGIKSLYNLEGLKSQLRVFSKGNSATEIVSVTLPYTGDKPPVEEAKALISRFFEYTGDPGNPAK